MGCFGGVERDFCGLVFGHDGVLKLWVQICFGGGLVLLCFFGVHL